MMNVVNKLYSLCSCFFQKKKKKCFCRPQTFCSNDTQGFCSHIVGTQEKHHKTITKRKKKKIISKLKAISRQDDDVVRSSFLACFHNQWYHNLIRTKERQSKRRIESSPSPGRFSLIKVILF